MARYWNTNRGQNRWEARDPWQPRDAGSGSGWLKRTAAAAVLFAAVYGAHVSDTPAGRTVTDAVRYALTTETDFAYLAERLASYAPQTMDVSVFRRLGGNATRPADPLQYMARPVEGKVVSFFGWQTHPVLRQDVLQEGIGLEAPLGAPVKAAAAGRVKAVTDSARFGKVMVIDHGKDVDSLYGHLSEVLVKEGEAVSPGQVVARVGKTGMTAGPLLYWEVREKGVAVDPLTRVRGGDEGR